MSTPLFAPVSQALVSLDPRTLAENYDEFQSDREITDILTFNPYSILRADMSHCLPGSPVKDLDSAEGLDFAADQLDKMQAEGHFESLKNFYFVYRIRPRVSIGSSHRVQIGLGGLAATSLIHDPASNPSGRIIRNEAIFVHKAEGRAKLAKRLGASVGTVNLCDPDPDGALELKLKAVAAGRRPDIASVDRKNDLHEVWLLTDAAECAAFTALMADREVFVADGNHRSKAAQMNGLERFLAVIFAGRTMHIDPYHRLMGPFGFGDEELFARLRSANFLVSADTETKAPPTDAPHRLALYTKAGWRRVVPTEWEGLDARQAIDAQLLEDRLVKGVLQWDAGDHRIAYVGGDYGPEYLKAKVDDGTFQAAFAMPAMTMPEFYGINRARLMLPRKTTWFTPKIRSGLVIFQHG